MRSIIFYIQSKFLIIFIIRNVQFGLFLLHRRRNNKNNNQCYFYPVSRKYHLNQIYQHGSNNKPF